MDASRQVLACLVSRAGEQGSKVYQGKVSWPAVRSSPRGAALKTRNLRVLQTLQEPPKPMLIWSASTRTGTRRSPSVSRNISCRAWASSLTSR
jgi:hypothetical protein